MGAYSTALITLTEGEGRSSDRCQKPPTISNKKPTNNPTLYDIIDGVFNDKFIIIPLTDKNL